MNLKCFYYDIHYNSKLFQKNSNKIKTINITPTRIYYIFFKFKSISLKLLNDLF